MPSIQEVNEGLIKDWEEHESKRNVLFSMLDDSDDDSPATTTAEHSRVILETRVRRALRQRNTVWRMTSGFVWRSPNSEPVGRRTRLQYDIRNHMVEYEHTTNRRAQQAKIPGIENYVYTTSKSTSQASDTLSTSPNCPDIVWRLQFKRLRIKDDNAIDIWTALKFQEDGLHKWWRRKQAHLIQSDSDGWSDMKRLGRRVAIQILERVKSSSLQWSRHINHLKMTAERAREIVLYQIIVCYNLPPNWTDTFQELVEYTVPIIYLTSEIIREASAVPPNGIAENLRIERLLESLNPYMRDVRARCYLFGEQIGFAIYNYMEDFMKGAIFDFDAGKSADDSKKSEFIELDHRLAGKSKDEYMARVGNIGQKQLKVKENIRNVTGPERQPSTATPGIMARLEGKVLEKIGLKELHGIIYDSRSWKGAGGYADVYKMNQSGNSEQVAVKFSKTGPSSAKRLEREARVWIDIKHKHIVPLLGFVIFEPSQAFQPCLVSKLCHMDLKCFVKMHTLAEARKLKFMRDIVLGLDYLHAMGISHGDLRAANVLVTNDAVDDDSCYALLNDFGMAEYTDNDINRILDSQDLSSVNQKTNDCWLAPELIEAQPRAGSLARVSKAGDVYAFGVVYLEVIFEKEPYEGTCFNIAYVKSIGELPAKEDELKPKSGAHWGLMKCCWEKAGERWEMHMVAGELLRILHRALPQAPDDYESTNMSGLPDGFTQYIM